MVHLYLIIERNMQNYMKYHLIVKVNGKYHYMNYRTDMLLLENDAMKMGNNNIKHAMVQMKGASERIFKLYARYLFEDEIFVSNDAVPQPILHGVISLGSRDERVLALAQTILDASVYDINCIEPVIEQKYDNEIDESCSGKDVVIIMSTTDEDSSNKQAASELKKAYHTLAHTLDKPALEKEFETNLYKGLTNETAARFLAKYGPIEWWLRLIKSVVGECDCNSFR